MSSSTEERKMKMKKLVVMCALAVAAFAANAASVKWSAANLYGSDGTTKFTGDVTLYCVELPSFTSVVKANNGAVATTTVSLPDEAGGTTKTFYLAFTDGGNTFTSANKTVAIPATASAGNAIFGNMTSQTQAWAESLSGGGSSDGTPEPTSGILLLVGAGILGLRRKRK